MSSLSPSQAFLNAPDDFLHPSSEGSDPANEIRPSIAPQDRLDRALKSMGHVQDRLDQALRSMGNDHQKTSSVSSPPHRIPITKASSDEGEPTETNVDTPEDREHVVDFEMHYGISQRSVREVLKEILEDVATHKNLHDWDSKLVVTPFKKLETVIRSFLTTCSQEMLNDLLIHSSVEEILRVDGKQQSSPAIQRNGQANGQFFFSKEVDEDPTTLKEGNPVKPSRGRVICVNECESHDERAALLWVHALCIRLQDEDKAYIRKFIEHHLSLKSLMATPYHWQPISPPESGPEQHQKHYRRVCMSFHLTYLVMSSVESPTERQGDLDRAPICALHSGEAASNTTKYYLFKASSSVLLTLVIPEESISREEEVQLLRSPQGLWTVLMINYPRQNSNRELEEHLTPVSQFIRGITAALLTQFYNSESIFGFLALELQSCDQDGLFDDPQFTKSKTYHRTIQGCNELKDSLDSTFRFMEKLNSGQLKELNSIVHSYEKPGMTYWTREMHEVLYSLKELRIQIDGLNKRALESRAALHGATAVLEARTALQQGQRLKVLAYLATLYLPLTATSSIFSMSVLPNSASFASFFVLLAILLIFTLSPTFYPALLQKARSIDGEALRASIVDKVRIKAEIPLASEASNHSEEISTQAKTEPSQTNLPTGQSSRFTRYPEASTSQPSSRVTRYIYALKPRCQRKDRHSHSPPGFSLELIKYIFHDVPTNIAFCYLIPELGFPIDQLHMYRHGLIGWGPWIWHPLALVRDVVRALLLPLWAVVVALIFVWLALLIVGGLLGGLLLSLPYQIYRWCRLQMFRCFRCFGCSRR